MFLHQNTITLSEILYDIDKDLKLKEGINKGFVTELAVIVWNDMGNKLWLGEPSEKSSWTSLKIPSEVAEKRPEIIVVGELEPKQKWCGVKRQKITS